jgi:hypothetical protein
MISVLIRDCSVDRIKEDEMGRAWCMYGIEEMCVWGLVVELKERHHMEDIGIDGRIMLKHTLKKENGRSWAHDGETWAFV